MVGLKAGFTTEQPSWLLCSGYVPAVSVEQANPVSKPKQLSELHCGKHVHYALEEGIPTVYINGDTDVCPPSISKHGGAGILIGIAVGLLDPPRNVHCAIISTTIPGKAGDRRSMPYICVPLQNVRHGNPQFDSTILTTRFQMQNVLNSVCRRISATPAYIEAALKVKLCVQFSTLSQLRCAPSGSPHRSSLAHYFSACRVSTTMYREITRIKEMLSSLLTTRRLPWGWGRGSAKGRKSTTSTCRATLLASITYAQRINQCLMWTSPTLTSWIKTHPVNQLPVQRAQTRRFRTTSKTGVRRSF